MFDSLETLAHRSDAETFEPGEPIYLEHEPGSLLFLLLEGEVELERDGRPVGEIRAGELFGEEALLGERLRPATARARTAARVVPVGPALYRHLADRDASFAWRVRSARRRRAGILATALVLAGFAIAARAQVWEPRNQLFSSHEAVVEDGNYGKAFAVGDFDGDGYDDLAIGAGAMATVEVYRGGPSGLSATLWIALSCDQAASHFGSALAAGDFDHDGRDELAVGAPYYTVSNPDPLPLAGRVFTFGLESGLWTEVSSFTQDTPGVPGASESDDAFGGALAAGNFNGDLYDDLAIGAPWEDVGATNHAGAVNLLYGGMLGLSTAGAQIWYRSGGGIDGTAAFQDLGSTLAVGDFDGDGFDDLAIGAPSTSVDAVSYTGDVVVLFGSSGGGLTAAGQQQLDPTDFGVAAGAQRFGAALAAADFDRDSLCELGDTCADDLAIGAPSENVDTLGGTADLAGAVYIAHGSRSVGGLDLASTDSLNQWALLTSGEFPEASDRFGFALSAGDLDRRTGAELVVGSPTEGADGLAWLGRADLFFGGTEHFDGETEQGLTVTEALASSPGIAYDEFGGALAIGDFDGDGTGDLAVGIVNRPLGGHESAGVVQVLYGALFADGFESNSENRWSSQQP